MLLRALFVLVLSIPGLAYGSIIVDVDTSTELSGSFAFGDDDFDFVNTALFGELPNGDNALDGGRLFADGLVSAFFGTGSAGTPDDPLAFIVELTSDPLTIPDVIGSFNNGANGELVTFALTNLMDTGGADGVFSGNFSFQVSPVPLPAAAWLFISAIGGLIGMKRVRRTRALAT